MPFDAFPVHRLHCSCMDVTEKVEGRKLIDLAHYDTLTSVFNPKLSGDFNRF